MPTILAIETSCDETSVAVVTGDDKPTVVVNEVASQIPLHQETGGVVPEVAAREQAVAMLPILERALRAADEHFGVSIRGPQPHFPIDAIAYTKEPGLLGSLLVGIETAETLAALWNVPARPVHHVQAHIYGAFAGVMPDLIEWPAVVLIVSGGHTQLWKMVGHLEFELLGQTRDDAAGEAFDKMARLLGLSYPGGPAISAAAAQASPDGEPIELPRPMLRDDTLDFSFSGLKTALLYQVRDQKLSEAEVNRYAAEAQQAVVDVLVGKTARAAEQIKAKTIVLAGGVAANRLLRESFQKMAEERGNAILIPDFSLCTDNAGMVGTLGWYQSKSGIMST